MQRIGEVLDRFPQPTKPRSNTVKNMTEEYKDWDDLPYRPNPDCPVCKGGGKTHPLDDGGKPIFSQLVRCPAPGCLRESFEAYRSGGKSLTKKGVSSKKKTFEAFNKDVAGVQEAYQAFYELAYNKTDLPFLLVYGGVGNGKTHLCEATTIVLHNRGIDARLYTVADLMSKLHDSISKDSTESEIKMLKEFPALILDDLGVEYGSLWELSKIEEIIDARYREQLITVLTTNRDLNQISERIVSRFSDPSMSRCLLNSARDYRRRK